MLLKLGSKGKNVKILQDFLKILVDGDFGPATEKAVKDYQRKNSLIVDGIVGTNTWNEMGLATTDLSENILLNIENYYLPNDEYKHGSTNKEYLFLHHTAGWHNPYNTINSWANDKRGTIGTEFVLGGQSIKGNDNKYDGKLLHAIPEGGYGWHLGKNGSQHMHTHSVAIEICNFGQLTKGGYYKWDGKKNIWIEKEKNNFYTWAGTKADSSQIVKLNKKFRGYKNWHKYSDEQINTLKNFILFIAERDNIDIHKGMLQILKKDYLKAFDFNDNAYYGKIKGMWMHVNTRKDKVDLFPQDELIDMFLSL